MTENGRVREINVYGEPAQVRNWTEDPWPEDVRLLSVSELDLLLSDASEIAEWSKRYPHPKVTPGMVNPLILDWIWFNWLQDPSEDKPEPSDTIRVLGAAFGIHLVRQLGMQWIEVTDQYGRDLCLRGGPKEMTISPYSSIRKRVQSRDLELFGALFAIASGE